MKTNEEAIIETVILGIEAQEKQIRLDEEIYSSKKQLLQKEIIEIEQNIEKLKETLQKKQNDLINLDSTFDQSSSISKQELAKLYVQRSFG